MTDAAMSQCRAARYVCLFFTFICSCFLSTAVIAQQAQPAAEPAEVEGVRYYDTSWDFDDVDVATLTRRLRRIGLGLPVDLSGAISGSLSVGVPWNALTTGRAWRFAGTLTSPELTINGFVIRDVSVRLVYRSGVLRLEQLRVGIPKAPVGGDQPDGVLTGTAQMELIPRGALTASAQLKDFPLSSLSRAFEDVDDLAGQLSGSLEAAVPVDSLRKPVAWRVAGPVTVEDVTFQGSLPANAAVQLVLDEGILSAQRFVLNIGDAQLTSNAQLNLLNQQPWEIEAAINAGSLAQLIEIADGLVEGAQLAPMAELVAAGAIQGTVRLAGTLSPFATSRVRGHAELANVTLQIPEAIENAVPISLRPIVIQQLKFDYQIVGEQLQLTQTSAAALGGEITGAVTLPLGEGPTLANLKWAGLQPNQVLARPMVNAGQFHGALALTIPPNAAQDPAHWEIRLNAALASLAYGDLTAANLQTGPLSLSRGRLQMANFTASLEGEPLSLSLDLLLSDPKTFSAAFSLPRVQLAWLDAIPPLADQLPPVTGLVSLTGQLRGIWEPLQLSGSGRVVGNDIRYNGIAIDALQFNFDATDDRVSINELQSRLYGGALAGDATLELGDAVGVTAQLAWNGVDVGRLLAPLNTEPVEVVGASTGSLNVTIPPGAFDDRDRWSATANLRLFGLDVYAWQFRQIEPFDLQLAGGQLTTPRLRALVDGGRLEAAVSIEIDDDYSLEVRGSADGAFVDRITAIPSLAFLRGEIGGRVGFYAHVRGSLNPMSLSVTGRAVGQSLRYDGVVIDRASFAYDFQPESLELSEIDALAYGGSITGGVKVPFAEEAAGGLDVAWNNLDAGAITRPLGALPVALLGRVSGRAELAIPPGAVEQPSQWSGDATLKLEQLNVYAWQFTRIQPITFRIENGQLEATQLNALLDGQPVAASLQLALAAPYNFSGEIDLEQFQFAQLSSIPQLAELRGRVGGVARLSASFQGTLDPLQFVANGSIAAQSLQFDEHFVEQLRFDFALQPEILGITAIEASIYDGRVAGTVQIPLVDSAAGAADLAWSDVTVGRLVDAFADAPITLQGVASGSIIAQIPAGMRDEPSAWNITARLALPDLRSEGVPIASLTVAVQQHERRLAYQADGRLLGGVLELAGERPADAHSLTGPAALGSAQLKLHQARLPALAQLATGPGAEPIPIRGTFSLNLQSTLLPEAWTWIGTVFLGEVTLAEEPITSGLELRIQGDEQGATLTGLNGQFAGGALGGSGNWQFAPQRAGAFRVNLRNASAAQVAILAAGGNEVPLDGRIDIDLLISPGIMWRIVGRAESSTLEVDGMAFRSVRLPIDVAWHPAAGRIDVRLTGVNLALAGGRITGRFRATQSAGWALDGAFRFFRVDVTQLADSGYGQGTLSGTLEISGRNVRSANDLNAVLLAGLEDTQATKLPIIGQLGRFVPGLASSASTFSDGRLEARLRRGVINVQELTLASSQLQLYATGRITLAGRLDLEAIVSTGDRIDSLLARNFLARLAVNTVTPARLLLEINDFLANRVIHLAIRGTISRPHVRVLPFQTLREEVVRFILREAVGAVVPGAAGVGALLPEDR